MKINSLHLVNIQSYTDETVTFDDGESLIYGENGAGKTTILRAIFGALFQDKSSKKINSNYTLDKLVRKGEDKGVIELEFEVAGEEYKIEWILGVTINDKGEREFDGTQKCVLTSPSFSSPIEGVRSVQSKVEELIGMDAQSFVNSVYVQQGDITRLLYSSPKQRKEIFDGLLGLQKIDTRIERLDEARLGVNDTLSATETKKNDIEDRLEELPDKEKVQELINSLNQSKQSREERESDFEEKLQKLKDAKKDLESKKEEFSDQKEELQELTDELNELKQERQNYQEEIEELEVKIEELGQKKENKKSQVRELLIELDIKEDDKEAVKDTYKELEKELEKKKEDKSNYKTELETTDTELEHITDEIARLEAEIEEVERDLEDITKEVDKVHDKISEKENHIETVEDELKETIEQINEKLSKTDGVSVKLSTEATGGEFDDLIDNVKREREKISKEIESAKEKRGQETAKKEFREELLETGICPVCETEHSEDGKIDVDEHSTTIDETVTNLEQQKEDLNRLLELVNTAHNTFEKLEDLNQNLSNLEEEREEALDSEDEFESEITEKQEILNEKRELKETKDSEAEELRSNISEVEEEITELQEKISVYKELYEQMDLYEQYEESIKQTQNQIKNKRELKQKTVEKFTEVQKRKQQLEASLGDIDMTEINSEIESISEDIKNIEEEKKVVKNELDEIRDEIASKKAKREQITEEEKRLQETKDRYIWLQERKEEIKTLKKRYKQVKRNLREENVALLNKFTNEVFMELHSGRSIQAIEIDSNYQIELVKQDNSRISPDMSSGGESNTINLAIRAGIYKLIAEREGSGSLPPFILDEPTQFLDDAHISELQSFIEAVKKWDIPQLLIVSHEPSLIDAANSILHVEIDRAKGESSVTKEYGSIKAGDSNVK